MKEELKARIVGHKLSSIIGVVGGAAISGAAGYYQASGGSLVDCGSLTRSLLEFL